ncbi:nucleotidyltransferase domain-containing protein [Gynuella sunshinyii]|uniref:Putative nucleotidyltransferase n=1 Tax=Gynuella sunshinyii YC6258 TaxID=1445510 RepID=A0A0C5VSB6_9GAMM|nr:nucleotidyltransferase domain-containing protein [Gynuella sunshinyii]AJQ93164.1 putative nucleotidyltransferase [Gynuella sunshinyii YC6258]
MSSDNDLKTRMRQKAVRAADMLVRRHQALLVILYGSVARGDVTENSDIDIACFCQNPQVSQDVQTFEGSRLDAWIYDVAALDPQRNDFLRMGGGEILFNDGIDGVAFLTSVQARIIQGPGELQENTRNQLIEWSTNMLQRAGGDSVEAHFRRCWLPCELLEIYFQLRAMWYLGSKQSFKWLRDHDQESFVLFQQCYRFPGDMVLIERLVTRVITIAQ